MGRALKPTRRVQARSVKAGDVVLVHYPDVKYSRWMIVDYAVGFGPAYTWSGRWVFGKDAGAWMIHAASNGTYVAKHRDDARRDAKRLVALPRNAHV